MLNFEWFSDIFGQMVGLGIFGRTVDENTGHRTEIEQTFSKTDASFTHEVALTWLSSVSTEFSPLWVQELSEHARSVSRCYELSGGLSAAS